MNEFEREKVKKLEKYRGLIENSESLEEKQEEIRTKLEGLGAKLIDGMPKSSGKKDPDKEKLIMAYDKNDRLLLKMLIEIENEKNKILKAINSLEDQRLRVLIGYRYLDCMKWEEICVKMHISWDTVHRWHRKALKHIDFKS